ncbi:MAG: hypothetical protein IKS19_06235 [Clostridia bacterium]|nr:hypothetical protein [Clostridia bacterium]
MQDNFNLDYTLTDKELYRGLRAAKTVPAKGLPQVIRTVLLLIVIGICCYNISIDKKYMTMALILIPIAVILIALIWIVPGKAFSEAAKAAENSRHVSMTVQPGLLRVDPETEIKLDGTSTVKDCSRQRTFLVYPAGQKELVYIIPYRVVDLDNFSRFREILMKQA